MEGNDKLSEEPKLKYPDCWPMVRLVWMDARDGETGWVTLSKMRDAKLRRALTLAA